MKSSLQRKSSEAPAQMQTEQGGPAMAPPAFNLEAGEAAPQTTEAPQNAGEEKEAPSKDGKPARIHIHADIDVEKMGIGALLKGQVGHTWASIEWKDPTAVSEKVKAKHPKHAHNLQSRADKGMFADPFGFWPYMFSDYDEATDQWEGAEDRVGYSSNPFDSYVQGQVVHPDTLHEKSVRATQSYDITEDEAIAAMDYEQSKQGAQYSVFWYNCTTFAKEAVEAAGKSAPSSSTLGICFPNKLYKSIKKNQKKGRGDTTVKASPDADAVNVVGEESKKNR